MIKALIDISVCFVAEMIDISLLLINQVEMDSLDTLLSAVMRPTDNSPPLLIHHICQNLKNKSRT